ATVLVITFSTKTCSGGFCKRDSNSDFSAAQAVFASFNFAVSCRVTKKKVATQTMPETAKTTIKVFML
ncbi:MAG TPA: hypothetical protein VGI63_01410, partial [Verrucomicrobiae bacterium]